jgi:cell division protein FtsI (penicillin-binding protein 3)
MYYSQTLSRIQRHNQCSQGYTERSLNTAKIRLLVVGIFLSICALGIGIRLATLMLFQHEGEANLAPQPTVLTASRANIVDRNGEILATNLAMASLYANGKEILDAKEVAEKLCKIFPDLSYKGVHEKLKLDKSFIWLRRNLTPKQQNAVHRLGLPGIYFQREEKRIYPYGSLTSHVVGYSDIDHQGIAGLEKKFDHFLSTQTEPLKLSLDIRIQHILRDELQKGIDEFRAKGANGIVIDANNGEIIAMVSLPDFNPHQPSKNPNAIFNTNTLGIYELGSIFKIFTVAMALDSGKIKLTDGFDTSEALKVGRFRITDISWKKRWLSIPEIVMYSSNIGTAKLALHAGKEHLVSFLDKIGFFAPVDAELPELATPMAPTVWREANVITASYGYGVAVSPLHIVTAFAGIVNGGIVRKPTIMLNGKVQQGKRIISEATSEKVRRLLHLTVKQGTNRKADVAGYVVGAKTGSANKQVNGGYRKDEHRASIVSAFPMTDPKYVVMISLDAPKGTKETFGFSTGGWTAAPVAKQVISQIAPLLGVAPIDESSKEIQSAMFIKVNPNDGPKHATG